MGLVALMVDGRLCAVPRTQTVTRHLLAATHEHALMLAQTEVGAKTNEISMFEPLLDSSTSTARSSQRINSIRSAGMPSTRTAAARTLFSWSRTSSPACSPPRPAGLAVGAGQPRQDRPSLWADRDPHHLDPPRPGRPAVPSRRAGLRRRTKVSPTRAVDLCLCGHLRRHQPLHPPRRPSDAGLLTRGHWESKASTGSATASTARTKPRSAPDQAPESWRRFATSPSAGCASSAATTSPKPPDGPPAAWTDRSPFSESRHDLETPVHEFIVQVE